MTTTRPLEIRSLSRWNFQTGWWIHLEQGPRPNPTRTTVSLTSVSLRLLAKTCCLVLWWLDVVGSYVLGLKKHIESSLGIWGLDYHILAGAIFGLALFFTGIFGWEVKHHIVIPAIAVSREALQQRLVLVSALNGFDTGYWHSIQLYHQLSLDRGRFLICSALAGTESSEPSVSKHSPTQPFQRLVPSCSTVAARQWQLCPKDGALTFWQRRCTRKETVSFDFVGQAARSVIKQIKPLQTDLLLRQDCRSLLFNMIREGSSDSATVCSHFQHNGLQARMLASAFCRPALEDVLYILTSQKISYTYSSFAR